MNGPNMRLPTIVHFLFSRPLLSDFGWHGGVRVRQLSTQFPPWPPVSGDDKSGRWHSSFTPWQLTLLQIALQLNPATKSSPAMLSEDGKGNTMIHRPILRAAASTLCLPSPALTWGQLGHRVIGELADERTLLTW